MARLLVKQINQALHDSGAPADVALYHGNGYWYFGGGDTARWRQQGVYVYRLNAMTVEQWVAEYWRMQNEWAKYNR